MLPISEFHFAFYGIATVAATLGYACARRAVHSLASSNQSSKADVEAGPPEERSLKRKLADSDEHDTSTEEQSRPMKRNRTPPTDLHEPDEDEWEVIVAPPPYEQVVGPQQSDEPVQDKTTPPQTPGDPYTIAQDLTPVQTPTPLTHPKPSPLPEENGVEARRSAAPQPPQVNLLSDEPEISPARQVTPPNPAVPAKIESVNAFSAFSGSSAPFASYSNTSGTSLFAFSGQIATTAPAWRRDNESESGMFHRTSFADALSPSPNDTMASAATVLSQSKTALAVAKESPSLAKSPACLTGEEDESIEAELKGVKLFIKRGRKEFTDGMYGHVKILAQNSTPPKTGDEDGTEAKNSSRTRLLFRRDPLGQVSMNIGLHPTVRCHFDAEENILRIILMEKVAMDAKDFKEDVVIYALKPGRVQKAEFQSFAKTLCDHEGFKARVVTTPTIPASGAAAAS